MSGGSGSGRSSPAQPAVATNNTETLHNGSYATIEHARAQQARFGIAEHVLVAWVMERERAEAEGRAFPLSLLSFSLLGLAGSRKAVERDARGAGVGRGAHFKMRGAGHPKAVPVITPAGRFGTLTLAAQAHGIGYEAARDRLRRGTWQRVPRGD